MHAEEVDVSGASEEVIKVMEWQQLVSREKMKSAVAISTVSMVENTVSTVALGVLRKFQHAI